MGYEHEHDSADRMRWYFYEDASGSWRWDAVGANGEVVARSGTAFSSRAQAVRDARTRSADSVKARAAA
jgi:uncharacterized protein YegP (UPF0339 family)